jgi:hypothetical protein
MKTQTPECDKALAIQDDSQKLGEFLDWLESQGIHLSITHEHNDYCYIHGMIEPKEGDYKSHDYIGQAKYVGEKELNCGYRSGEFIPFNENYEKLLARYFIIDLNKVEKEKQAILKELREAKPNVK